MGNWKWLSPGLNVKRWICLIIFGAFLFTFGLAIIIISSPNYSLIFTLVLTSAGLGCIIAGVRFLVRSIVESVAPGNVDHFASTIYRNRNLRKGPKVVVIGGGTGLASLLRGMKQYTNNITAIVTVADDGGSSGRIRDELGILPPGDIRNTLIALADTEPLMERLFQYRFSWGQGLSGHSFGNLFIAAMTDITGDFETAIRKFSKVLAVGGTVLPATLETVRLKARYTDGTETIGESRIPQPGKTIEKVSLVPHRVAPLKESGEAILAADLIVLGPGSLYTSIIPNLLVNHISNTLASSKAIKVYVGNIMTQPGETDHFSASDHLKAIFNHTKMKRVCDYALFNNAYLSADQAQKYSYQKAYPIKLDLEKVRALGVTPLVAPLLDQSLLIRHNSELLAQELVNLWLEIKSNRS